jgi:hypothetical protein
MNQEEKTRKTREKIMSAAMHEFASNVNFSKKLH